MGISCWSYGGGDYRGPLHGVPIGIKDLADVEGAVTTAGSDVFGNRPALSDASLVQLLKQLLIMVELSLLLLFLLVLDTPQHQK